MYECHYLVTLLALHGATFSYALVSILCVTSHHVDTAIAHPVLSWND